MRVRLKGITGKTVRLADGRVQSYWYAWKGGPRLKGEPGTAEFMAFLGKYFTKVGQAPFSQFEPKMADGYDVVIFDAEPKPTPNSIGMPPRPNLPRDYDRATVLIGGAVMVTLPLQTKIDWL